MTTKKSCRQFKIRFYNRGVTEHPLKVSTCMCKMKHKGCENVVGESLPWGGMKQTLDFKRYSTLNVLEGRWWIYNQHRQGKIAKEKQTSPTICLGLVGDSTTLQERDSGWELGGKKPGNPNPYKHRKCWSGSSLPGWGEPGVTELSPESQQPGLSLLLSPEKTGYVSGRESLKQTCCFTQNPACAFKKKKNTQQKTPQKTQTRLLEALLQPTCKSHNHICAQVKSPEVINFSINHTADIFFNISIHNL